MPYSAVDEPSDDTVATDADLERNTNHLKKLGITKLVAVAKKFGIKRNVDGVKKTKQQLAEEVSKVLNA